MFHNNFDMNELTGLTSQEVLLRQNRDGFNELSSQKQTTIVTNILRVLREPMLTLLLLGAVLYFFLGAITEAFMLLCFVLFVMGITVFQEYKSDRALWALRKLSSPRALVIREGKEKRIPGCEVVMDDILVVTEGDCVPADACLLYSTNLNIDESILTGESLPVAKDIPQPTLKSWSVKATPPEVTKGYIFSGTYVVQGHGIAQVTAIADKTEMGKIGKSLSEIKIEKTPLQKETNAMVRSFATAGLVLCTIIAIYYGITQNNWLQGFLAGITLAMSILPEEFPVILTVFLAIGAWRISRKRVLTRKISAIEALGSATVLCVDKTGTLTENRMALTSIYVAGQILHPDALTANNDLPEHFHNIIEYSVLACQNQPFDPMELAIKKFAHQYLHNTEHLHHNWHLMHQYPLSSELLAISLVWKSTKNQHLIVATKGAPEAIFDLCHFSPLQIAEYLPHITTMAAAGLRVLGVARAIFAETELPHEQHDFNFEFLGLIGLSDPIRGGVAASVRKCYSAGVRVIMLTGDYPGTAKDIAAQIGLHNAGEVISGAELDKMTDFMLRQKIKHINVFARIMPQQKLRLVDALKANNEVVAMTGDGVNDAPALKSAYIGIAMGKRGTDVAREAASLVLLNDDFSSIVTAIRMGRRIYANIKKAVIYTIAVHIPIIGMSLVPVLCKLPLVLMPLHIVFLELIIDPTCSLVFEAEPEEANIMQQPPRKSDERLFDKKTFLLCLLQGLLSFVPALAIFLFGIFQGYDWSVVRAMTFIVMVISNLVLIFVNRLRKKDIAAKRRRVNKLLWLIVILAFALLAAVIYVPFLQHLFYFSNLNLAQLMISVGSGMLVLLVRVFNISDHIFSRSFPAHENNNVDCFLN